MNTQLTNFVDVIQIIGYLGAFTIAISLLPQVIKSWKTKSTKDISILWNSIYIIGLSMILVYAIGINEMPIIIGAIIEISLAVSLFIAKVLYK